MNKFFKWIKEHVRPYVKYNNPYGDFSIQNDDVQENEIHNVIDKIENRTEIGIQLEFKF